MTKSPSANPATIIPKEKNIPARKASIIPMKNEMTAKTIPNTAIAGLNAVNAAKMAPIATSVA